LGSLLPWAAGNSEHRRAPELPHLFQGCKALCASTPFPPPQKREPTAALRSTAKRRTVPQPPFFHTTGRGLEEFVQETPFNLRRLETRLAWKSFGR